jgi:aminopeptidase N
VLSAHHLVLLADLLDRDPAECGLAGLDIDTDLRWRIVTALAAGGHIDADGPQTPFIDAEAIRDPTAAGKRHAATAAAARPQAEVKRRAWQEVIEDDTLPNATARAIITGWAQPGQGEFLKPFTEQYFHAIGGLWERRSSEVAQTAVVGLYPSWDVSPAGLAAAERFLGGELPPALRRLVLEGRAGVERAVRARAFDGGD